VIERYTERDTILLARYHLPPLPLHTFTGLAKNMNSGGEEKETQACSTFKQQESLHYQSLVSIGFDLILTIYLTNFFIIL